MYIYHDNIQVYIATYVAILITCVMSFSKAIDPDHDISDHHYYDNYTAYSYYCSNYYSTPVAITIATIYMLNKQYNMRRYCLSCIAMHTVHTYILCTYVRTYICKKNLAPS